MTNGDNRNKEKEVREDFPEHVSFGPAGHGGAQMRTGSTHGKEDRLHHGCEQKDSEPFRDVKEVLGLQCGKQGDRGQDRPGGGGEWGQHASSSRHRQLIRSCREGSGQRRSIELSG